GVAGAAGGAAQGGRAGPAAAVHPGADGQPLRRAGRRVGLRPALRGGAPGGPGPGVAAAGGGAADRRGGAPRAGGTARPGGGRADMSERGLTPLRIGTRGSPLALWQARYFADRLGPLAAPGGVELVLIETEGDRVRDRALSQIGGDGLFTKEIQT